MPEKRTPQRIVRDNEGMVLILVLIVLVATIIIGTTVMRTTTVDTKITGNERIVMQNFNKSESGTEFALDDHISFVGTLGIAMNTIYTYTTTGTLPSDLDDLDELSVSLFHKGAPPIAESDEYVYGIGGENELESRYYQVNARRGNEQVEVSAFKMFPRVSE